MAYICTYSYSRSQAKVWNREVGITGLVITKLDGTARGGVVVSIVRDVGVPVKLIGVGEGISDLRDFDPEVFVDALLGYEVSLLLLLFVVMLSPATR